MSGAVRLLELLEDQCDPAKCTGRKLIRREVFRKETLLIVGQGGQRWPVEQKGTEVVERAEEHLEAARVLENVLVAANGDGFHALPLVA